MSAHLQREGSVFIDDAVPAALPDQQSREFYASGMPEDPAFAASVQLHVDGARSPSDVSDAPDGRRLGIALSNIGFSPHFSPAFVARASRCRCGGSHGLNDAAGVVVTTSKRREGVRPATASGSAAAAEGW